MHQNESHPLIGRVSHLCVRFAEQRVLNDLSIELYKNRVHLLCGPSGAGKSTFLRGLNRLNDCFAGCTTTGEIALLIDGCSVQVNSLKPYQLPALRRRVGMVFQYPQLLPGSISDNLLLPLKVVGQIKGRDAFDKIEQACTLAAIWPEIKDRLSHDAASLSGGQQQRLCLARTLALEPEILLLDEPTSSLDPASVELIEECIVQLAQNYTIVMVSHNEAHSERLAHYTIRFDKGRVVV